jgi:hypothetical protein
MHVCIPSQNKLTIKIIGIVEQTRWREYIVRGEHYVRACIAEALVL